MIESNYSGYTGEPVVNDPQQAPRRRKRKRLITRNMLIAIIGVACLVIATLVYLVLDSKATNAELAEDRDSRIQQLELENDMIKNERDLKAIDAEFAGLDNLRSNAMREGSINLKVNDSILDRYNAARAQAEMLLNELQNERTRNKAQIDKLNNEIATLRGILKDYTRQINELMEENENLRAENKSVKDENARLRSNVATERSKNEVLTQRMELAEKLNATGLNIQALNKKDKKENNITKAKKLMVTFTLPPNNSTPAGEHVIYLRITSPEGDLLGNAGTFDFEGAQVPYTARTTIEYANEEIGNIPIYWDNPTVLSPGDYTVELFTDGYRIASRVFTLKK